VFLVVFWRLRYKLSLRDLAEMLLIGPAPTVVS
jgi:transposase-like protein